MLAFDLQGGGLYILSGGTATLINSNIYSNTASSVRARLCVTFHRPLELALELTGCCARAHECGVTAGECLHFGTFPDISSIAPLN